MRLEALSFKLMDLLNLDRGNFILEEMDAEQLLDDVRASILPAAQKRGVAIQSNAAPGWVRVEYDLFKTLLMNLLDNALKSGATTVGLYGVPSGGSYRISVVDNGRGIPEAELRRITEAFYMVGSPARARSTARDWASRSRQRSRRSITRIWNTQAARRPGRW